VHVTIRGSFFIVGKWIMRSQNMCQYVDSNIVHSLTINHDDLCCQHLRNIPGITTGGSSYSRGK